MKQHFVRLDLILPDAQNSVGLISIADLTEIDSGTCIISRMIEMTPDESIVGAYLEGKTVGSINLPEKRVPHPDTYDDFPAIRHRRLTDDEFSAIWAEAQALFPDL